MKTTANHLTIGAAAVVLGLLTNLSSAHAQAPMEPTTIGRVVSGLNPMNWQMPQWKMPNFKQLLPGQDEKTQIKKKKDGLVDEVTKTASNSWSKTKRAMNPAKFFPASARTPAYQRGEETKPGFFRSLFAPAPPQQDNSTVTDFLRQSRPSP